MKRCITLALLGLSASCALAGTSQLYSVTVAGTDAIFLAGRTDVVIPPSGEPWNTGTHLIRHAGPTPEEALETLPPAIYLAGGDVVQVLDAAEGGINFFNGFGPPFFGPAGNGAAGSLLTSLDGISGYAGPQGPLTGVFLSDAVPNGPVAPARLDFTPGGIGTDFLTLSPELGQVFYIGDGVTSADVFQSFIAPAGATRLFLGIPDGFGFGGAPGAYDDNDGAYLIRLGVNRSPIPEPLLLSIVVPALTLLRRR
jgi:hypothetical protein